MKRSLILIFFTIIIFAVGAFSASALQSFEEDGLSFSVPDIMENDAQWAQQHGYSYSFSDSEEIIELNVSVYPNEGFSFAGMDEESLENYASSLEDNLTQEGYVVESIEVVAYNPSDSIDGINISIVYASGEKADFYWLATESMCYDLDFWIYDDSYAKYISEVMGSVSIEASADEDTPVTMDQDIDADIPDAEEYPSQGEEDNVAETVTTHGLTVRIPGFMLEDKEWAQNDEQDIIYTTPDYLFQVGVQSIVNTDSISFVGMKDKEVEELFAELKKKTAEDYEKYELVRYEKIEVNGFEGLKLVINAVEKGYAEYEKVLCYFSTKDYYYVVSILNEGEIYREYIDTVINSIEIDGKPMKRDMSSLIYVIVAAVAAGVSALIGAVKKKKAKKNAEKAFSQMGNNPVYFNPQTDAYRAQYMPNQNAAQQAYPQQPPVQNNQGNGYIENSGYAPDYDYSNKLDITLNGTDDFSKTEYRRATADMEKRFSEDEEE